MDRLPKPEPARPEEWETALRLVFQCSPAAEQEIRVQNAVRLLNQGELDPAGILVIRGTGKLLGAAVCLPTPGAGGLVWPPQAELGHGQELIEDQLLRSGLEWLRRRGAKLAQALLLAEELGAPLLRNGFRRVTSLCYFRHALNLSQTQPPFRLSFEAYGQGDHDLFHRTLLRTYEGTQDCPEVNGIRTLDEIMEGHRAQGVYQPGRWWLAAHEQQAVGVLLMTEIPEWQGWDLSYLGIVPEARRRGLGKELTRKALLEARAAGATQVTLAVDTRNQPAFKLYTGQGFEPFDYREVYLAFLAR
jgi:ribosomal protein S18 acetylase RimI-like enzyme